MHIKAINLLQIFFSGGPGVGCKIDICVCDGCVGGPSGSDMCGGLGPSGGGVDYCLYQDKGSCDATDVCNCVDSATSPSADDTHKCGSCDTPTTPGADNCDGHALGTNDWVDCGQHDWACNNGIYAMDIICLENESHYCIAGVDTPCIAADIFCPLDV